MAKAGGYDWVWKERNYPMINRGTLIWMLLAMTAGIGLFLLKYEVRAMEERLVQIKQKTIGNLEAVHLLTAEWSFLNQPRRLEDLGRRLLALEPMESDQAVKISDIPVRSAPGHSAKLSYKPTKYVTRSPEISPAAGQGPPHLATYRRAR